MSTLHAHTSTKKSHGLKKNVRPRPVFEIFFRKQLLREDQDVLTSLPRDNIQAVLCVSCTHSRVSCVFIGCLMSEASAPKGRSGSTVSRELPPSFSVWP